MTMRFEGTFLRSVVARRVFFLFVLSAFVPAAMLAALSYGHVRGLVGEYAQRQLVQAGSAHTRSLYERMLAAHFILNANATQVRTGQPVGDQNQLALQRIFRRVYVVVNDHMVTNFGSNLGIRPPPVGPGTALRLAKGEVTLLLPPPAPSAGSPWLVIAVDPAQAASGVIEAEFDPAYLWGDREDIPYQMDICVLAEGAEALYCSNDKLESIAKGVALRGVAGKPGHADGWSYATSGLFLKAKFGAPEWTVVAVRPGGLATALLTQVPQTFFGVTLLTLLLVALLSVVQIRRTLVPLERLIEGTRRITREEFDQPVNVERNDEFGQLARSFNNMASRLGRQIGALRALSDIDQEILSHLDIEQIVERVQARLQEILPKAVVGVILFDHASVVFCTAYLRQTADAKPSKTQIPLKAKHMAEYARYQDGVWCDVNGPDVPAFVSMQARLGASHCFVIPIFWRDEMHSALVIGVANQKDIDD